MASPEKRGSSTPLLAGRTPALASSSRAWGEPGLGSPLGIGKGMGLFAVVELTGATGNPVVAGKVVRGAVVISEWEWCEGTKKEALPAAGSGVQGLDLVQGLDQLAAAQQFDRCRQRRPINGIAAQQ